MLAVITLVFLGAFIFNWAVDDAGYLRGFVGGLVVSSYLGVIGLTFLLTTEGAQQLAGAWGEDNTRAVLDQARRRRLLWGSVHSIELRVPDIDHLVIAPGGAISIETKWHFRSVSPWMMDRDVRQALTCAHQAELILLSKTVDVRMPVTPVVVVWGGGQKNLPSTGLERDGVLILPGHGLAAWLEGWSTGLMPEDFAKDLLGRLSDFADSYRGKRELPRQRQVSVAAH